MKPLLRPINFQHVHYQGQQLWLLDDTLKLSDQQMLLPWHLARMVSSMDGTQTLEQLHQQLCHDAGEPAPFSIVEETIAQLDQNFLLDNARSQSMVAAHMAEWRAQPFRPPAFAGLSYPEQPDALADYLNTYSAGDSSLATWPAWQGRGLVTPHIDYQRGGHVYAQVWQRARAAIESAELILIFGTDHKGGASSLTLSSLPYATPWGILPTDQPLVDDLAATIGAENAYRLELNHQQEHAIELATTWLHYIRPECCPVVPILVGSFHHLTPNRHPSQEKELMAFIERLRELTVGRRVFSIASIDLAHVGPAFDSDYKMDASRRDRLRQTDATLMEAVARGDRESWYRQLAMSRNANNVCGFSPLWMMMEYMGETRGQQIAYDQCSADTADTSVVSVCGMLLE